MRILILFISLAFLASCSPSLSPFTAKLQRQNDWSENELKRIQFYLSDDITLRRQITKGSSKIESGEIKIVDGKKVEEVHIPKGTPGVLVYHPKENRFGISFEAGNKHLMFGPNPKRGGQYVLLASEWKSKRGKVEYDEKTYFADRNSALATLMVNLKKAQKISTKSRTAKGRKVH